MLYLVGLGLDLSPPCSALPILREVELYLELHTLPRQETLERLKAFHLSPKVVGRKEVEEGFILSRALSGDVALLSLGDPLFATTHYALLHEVRKRGGRAKVFHNASIMDAVGESGLSPYKFGRTVTIAKWRLSFQPISPLEFIEKNLSIGLHTLVLVDVPEGRFMSLAEVAQQIRAMEARYGRTLFRDVVVLSDMGGEGRVAYGPLEELAQLSLREPISLIVPGPLSPVEEEFLSLHRVKA